MLELAQVASQAPLARTLTPTESPLPTETFTTVPSETPTSTVTPTPTVTLTPTSTFTPTVTRTRAPTTPTASPRVVKVPILMYHYVSTPPDPTDKIRLDLSVTPDAFEAQLNYLAANGYHPIRLSDLASYLLTGAPLPDKPIILTFDDGYSDIYANAFPSLRNKKFPATFFIITEFVNENRWGYVNWAQLAEMAKDGMEIGSHSLDHPDLYRKSKTFQNNEVAGSKKMIEANVPVTVVSFSYPAGHYDANTLAALRAAGYQAAVTEDAGERQSTDRIYEMRRIRVRGTDPIDRFAYWLKYYEANGK